MYVIAKLHSLQILDGKQIKRSERIVAGQMLSSLALELRGLAEGLKRSKRRESNGGPCDVNEGVGSCIDISDGSQAVYEIGGEDRKDGGNRDSENLSEHTPEVRAEISREMAQQKAEKEQYQKDNQPKKRGEKEFEEEQAETVRRAREREERGQILQRNEGKWNFSFDEEQKPGFLLLDITIQKHLSTSLIDVDIHPSYVSVVIKSKTLCLVLPTEVKSNESTAQRSTVTGHMLITMPKVHTKGNVIHVGVNYKKSHNHTYNRSDSCTVPVDSRRTSREGDDIHNKSHLWQTRVTQKNNPILEAASGRQKMPERSFDLKTNPSAISESELEEDSEEPPPIF